MASPFTTDAGVLALFQENLLQGIFRGPLVPEMLFRGAYNPEYWADQALSVVKTAHGAVAPKATPRAFGADPTASTFEREQWNVTIAQYADRVDLDKIQEGLSPLDLYKMKAEALALGAGRTINVLSRYPLYNAALAGQTLNTTVGNGTSKAVLKINGFTHAVNAAGVLAPVSAANPLAAYFWNSGTSSFDTVSVIGATPDTAGDEYGPGTLTLAAAYDSTDRQPLVARTASYRIIEGGGYSIDDVGDADTLSAESIIKAAARLRDMGVPRFADGFYHGFLGTTSMRQLLADPEVQLLLRGTGLDKADVANPYVTGKVPVLGGVALFETPEAAGPDSIPSTYGTNGDKIAAEFVNATSKPLHTVVVMGAGGATEYWRQPLKSMRNSGAATGQIGNWTMIGSAGMVADTERIELAVRFPTGSLLDIESMAYSYMGVFTLRPDWTAIKAGPAYPSLPSTCRALYKRVVPIIHVG